METILVQINDNKAYKLLEDLEALHIIKLLKRDAEPTPNLSDKYAGKLPLEVADEIQNYISKSRDEWNNNI